MTRFLLSVPLALALASGAVSQDLRGPRGCYAKVQPFLEKSGGVITPEVREAYLKWAESGVLTSLRNANRYPDDEVLAEVDKDPTTRQAVFGSVYPPDPSILQNYQALRRQMGQLFVKNYHPLAIAVSIARRTKGVEGVDSDEIGRENQPSNWIDVILRAPANPEERTMVKNIAAFLMDVKEVSPLELYKEPASQKKLIAYLKNRNESPTLISSIATTVQFGEWIKNAMILDKLRPPARDPKPISRLWLTALVDRYNTKPKSTPPGIGWPLFPMKEAPWPLLMPLVHAVPLKESDYIWDAFQGLHGDDRFHTYGPYRDDITAMPDMLLPSKWFWDAFPDRIIHGGECIPISKGTVDLYSTLAEPAMAAAQPGHSNLITFQDYNDTWKAVIEQDFCGGAHVTFAQWFFDDDERPDLDFRGLYGWAGAEYQVGLALGMNLGVESYMDVRMASNIFQSMSDDDQKTVGRNLLLQALEKNPFDPDPWYRLFQISSSDQKFALARAIRARNPAGLVPNGTCPALDSFVKSNRVAPAAEDMDAYWGNIEEFGVHNYVVVGDGPHDEAAMMSNFKFLQGSPWVGPQILADYAEKFVGGSSPETLAADTAVDAKLADQGDAYGRFRMAQRYLAGDGVPANEAKAREMFGQGVKAGDGVAGILLERMNPALPTDNLTVTASSVLSDVQAAKHLVDGSGMLGGSHDNSEPAATMWTSAENPPLTTPAPGLIPPAPAWVKIDFPTPQLFDAVEIWNHNQAKLTNRGFKRLTIYGSTNGSKWYELATGELPQAAGNPGQEGTVLDRSCSGRAVRSVVIAAEITDGNYGGSTYGLSAVRFLVHGIKSAMAGGQISVTASSEYSPTQSVQHLVDGAGMAGEYHDNSRPAATMWQTTDPAPMTTPAPGLLPSRAWVRFDFSHPRTFDEIMIWNHNQEGQTTRGFKKTRIYGTTNGTDWFPITSTEVITLPKADGSPACAAVNIPNADPKKPLKSVIIAADYNDGNYGASCYGLSAVKFISH